MGREHLRTPDTDVLALRSRVTQLFQQALPDPFDRAFFDNAMNEANAQGLNWIEGLEYTVAKRRSRLQAAGVRH